MSKPARSVRFTQVVKRAGSPAEHLVLAKPESDQTLARAQKEHRVMTVHRPAVGTKADHGEIGFSPGPLRQFLIFPRSLRAFAGQTVIGVKYELFEDADLEDDASPAQSRKKPDPKPPEKPRPAPKASPKPKPKSKPRLAQRKKRPERDEADNPKPAPAPAGNKVIAFPRPAVAKADDAAERNELRALKRAVRQALRALESGKQVVAFRLLEKILADAP